MGEAITSYRDLKVWILGLEIVHEIYSLTIKFPSHELYGLTNQLRRAAVSIPANIAEGHGRDSTKEYLRHISIAYGSLCEIETLLQIAGRLQYLSDPQRQDLTALCDDEGRMLRALRRSLRTKLAS